MIRSIRAGALGLCLGFLTLTGGAALGLATASLTAPQAHAKEGTGCEHDRCARICVGEVCGGDCFDSQGATTNCDQIGSDCEVTEC